MGPFRRTISTVGVALAQRYLLRPQVSDEITTNMINLSNSAMLVSDERASRSSDQLIIDSFLRRSSTRMVPGTETTSTTVGNRGDSDKRTNRITTSTNSPMVHSSSSSQDDTDPKRRFTSASSDTSVVDNLTKRSGRWSLDEKILFLYGLRRFGKGRWKKISIYLPDRSLVQIKSHAQKVLKRVESGENVFRRLHENVPRTDALVQVIHGKYCLDSPEWWTAKRKVQDAADVAEQLDAASALCQLSSHSTASSPPPVSSAEPDATMACSEEEEEEGENVTDHHHHTHHNDDRNVVVGSSTTRTTFP